MGSIPTQNISLCGEHNKKRDEYVFRNIPISMFSFYQKSLPKYRLPLVWDQMSVCEVFADVT